MMKLRNACSKTVTDPQCITFEVLMEVKIETVVSCFMTVCNLVGGYQHVSKHQPHYMVTLNLKTIVYRVLRERWGKF